MARDWLDRVGGTLVEEPENIGLALSISKNVTKLCEQFGQVIVVEDDLYVSPDFLDFMLRSLDAYRDCETVWHIGGFMYPVHHSPSRDCFFLPYASVWGWATWQRAWRQYDFAMPGWQQLLADAKVKQRFDLDGAYPYSHTLRSQALGLDATWDIQWYYAVFRAGGLGLYPRRSLVRNGGLFGAASHPSGLVNHSPELVGAFDMPRLPAHYTLPSVVQVNAEAYERVKHYLRVARFLEVHHPLDHLLYAPFRLAYRLNARFRGSRT
jgi:hypothetical protein